jgi:hydroxymethylpyrimidine pyrophosphatase-like HAD family hydrolase
LTLIVFDLDGTLLDGYAGISDALGFAMERRIVHSKALFCLVPRRTDKGFNVLFIPATPRSTQASRVVDR